MGWLQIWLRVLPNLFGCSMSPVVYLLFHAECAVPTERAFAPDQMRQPFTACSTGRSLQLSLTLYL
jgi:hypothetical protein